MDFDLGPFQQVFKRLDTTESSRAPLAGSDNAKGDIQELRELSNGLIIKLKAQTESF